MANRVTFYGGAGVGPDIWMLDTRRGVYSRLTSDAADDVMPVWSPDGGRIVFSSNRTGVHDLYQKSVTGDRGEELLLATPQPKIATDWSPDGHFLLFTIRDPKKAPISGRCRWTDAKSLSGRPDDV